MKRTEKDWIGMDKVIEVLRLTEQGLSQRAIAKSVCVSRTTVQQYQHVARAHGVQSEDLHGFSSEEVKDLLGLRKRGKRSLVVDFDASRYVEELNKNPKLTRYLLWEEYREEHRDGLGYSQFCALLREHRKLQNHSLRQVHPPGEKAFVDWAGTKFSILESGAEPAIEASIFVGTLGYSNLLYIEACRNQQQESWINCHINMFEYFGGVTKVVIPDNTKTGVTDPCYYEPSINKTYHDFARHYDVAVLPTRPGKPKDKGKVESGVGFATRQIVGRFRNIKFTSFASFVVALQQLMNELNSRTMQDYKESRQERFTRGEKQALKALPAQRFQAGLWHKGKVGVDYHVELQGHYYSVPHRYVGFYVELRYTQHTVEIFHENKRITQHVRSHDKGQHTTSLEHMPSNHRFVSEWSPSRFSQWAAKIGPETKGMVENIILAKEYPEQGYRAALGVLNLGKKYGNSLLETACYQTNQAGESSYRAVKHALKKVLEDLKNQKNHTPVVHENLRSKAEFK